MINARTRSSFAGLVSLLLAVLTSACGGIGAPYIRENVPIPDAARTSHVVVVSIDGLSPSFIETSDATALMRLRREGAHARVARTIVPSLTLPSHTSMITGVDVDQHGITWNTDQTATRGVVGVPTMLEVAHDRGLVTAAFVGKRKLKHLLRPGSLDHQFYPNTDVYYLADRVAENVVYYLRFRRPNLLFVHLPDPDFAGHSVGWGSVVYRHAVRRASTAVERIHRAAVRAFGDDLVFIVTADHGGEGRTHGSDSEADRRIPWIAWGEGVVQGEIQEEILTFDTAATALWLLGIPVPENWDGEPVTEAFREVRECVSADVRECEAAIVNP